MASFSDGECEDSMIGRLAHCSLAVPARAAQVAGQREKTQQTEESLKRLGR